MFIVEIGAVWSTVLAIFTPSWFAWLIVFWLWLTVVFANLAEAVAEGRGKVHRPSRCGRPRRTPWLAAWPAGSRQARYGGGVAAPLLNQGDIVVVETGQVIPVTATSWKASPRWMSRPSPESPRR